MSETPDMFSEGSASTFEFGPGEIHRIHSSRNIKTLKSVKENLKFGNLSAEKIKDFLQDTSNSVSFENEDFTNPQNLEKVIYKQQFLENNNLFNPAQYFGGMEITNFEDHALEQKLDYMFMEYLPTEMEEKSEYEIKQNMDIKPSYKTKKPDPFVYDLNNKFSTQKKKSNQRSIDFFSNLGQPNRPSQLHTESITSFAEAKSKHSKDSGSAHKNLEHITTTKKRSKVDNGSVSKQVHTTYKDLSAIRSSNNFRNSKGLSMKSKEKYPVGKENICKNSLTSPANLKLKNHNFDTSNCVESPLPKNLGHHFKTNLHSKKPSDLVSKAINNFSSKQSNKKSSSFISYCYLDSVKHNLEQDIASHPRTANPSFVETEFNPSDSNFNCAKVLRTTNDTDKEIDTQERTRTKPKIFGNILSKPGDRLYVKTGFGESPICHLKMPKSDTFYESRKKKPIFQRYGTES